MGRPMKSLFIIFLTLLFSVSVVSAQSTDEVVLQKPTEGSTISNTYEIEWKIVDADIENPAYFIDVFNLACTQSGGNLGRITNSDATVENNIYTYSWDTKSGNLSNSLQSGGNYCMRVCGILADGGSVYSKCDKKSFVFSSEVTGTNKPPVITPAGEGFKVTLNEIFNYKVVASDPDGDELKYSFLNAPDFLTIDSKTGQISGKPTEVGDIRFIVKVDDSKGGITTEEFILNIQLTNTEKEVVFEFPKTGSTVTPDNNIIKWKVKSGLVVKSITLSYSSDKDEWIEITKQDRDLGQYTWNISDIEDGEYFIRFLLVDQNNKLFEIFSDGFQVSSQGNVTETEITSLSPEEGSTINNNRPVISAEFRTPEGITIAVENIKFTLNDRIDLTLCDITASNLSCEIVGELSNETYTAFIELKDSSGATLIKEWKFNIDSDGQTDEETEDTGGITGSSMQLILIIFAVGFLLIALPWSIYLIVKKRKNKTSEVTKLPEDSVIHPITPITPEQTQPVIGSQGLDMGQALNPNAISYQPNNTNLGYPIEPPIVNNNPQPSNMITDDIQPQQITNYPPQSFNTAGPQTVNVNNQGNPIESPTPSSENVQEIPTNSNLNNLADQNVNMNQNGLLQNPGFSEPEIVTPQIPNANPLWAMPTNNSQSQVVPTASTTSSLPNNATNNFDQPVVVEQPAMYRQEEIPAWLATDLPDTSKSEESNPSASTMDQVLTKTEIQEGSKVFDPYGLALKTDETEDPDVSPQIRN
jgi:hypothetical protein